MKPYEIFEDKWEHILDYLDLDEHGELVNKIPDLKCNANHKLEIWNQKGEKMKCHVAQVIQLCGLQ